MYITCHFNRYNILVATATQYKQGLYLSTLYYDTESCCDSFCKSEQWTVFLALTVTKRYWNILCNITINVNFLKFTLILRVTRTASFLNRTSFSIVYYWRESLLKQFLNYISNWKFKRCHFCSPVLSITIVIIPL
jgi:hypothetical protein